MREPEAEGFGLFAFVLERQRTDCGSDRSALGGAIWHSAFERDEGKFSRRAVACGLLFEES